METMMTVAMVTYQIVFTRKFNENVSTKMDVLCLLSDFTGNLDATGTFCLAFDDDRLVSAPLFEVRDVSLPESIPVQTWIKLVPTLQNRLVNAVQRGVPADYAMALLHLSQAEFEGVCTLLTTKKFRSEFRASMRDQVVTWCATPAHERKFSKPLSPKQFMFLVRRSF